jgi:NitT/TauT family transport system substrate-binding protein
MWRRIAVGGLILIVLQACGPAQTTASPSPASASTSAAPTEVPIANINFGVQTSSSYAPAYVALAKGFFTKNRLNVNVVKVTGGTTNYAALASGSLDITSSAGTELATAVSRGETFKAIAASTCRAFQSVVVRNGVAATKMADLKGMRIGVTAFGAASDVLIRYLIREAGLDPEKDVKVIAIGGTQAAYVAALKGSQIDAAFSFMPITTEIVDVQKLATLIVDFNADSGPTAPPLAVRPGNHCLTFMTSAKFLAGQRDVAKRFVLAIREADAWANDPKNTEEFVTLLADGTGSAKDAARFVVEHSYGAWSTYLPPSALANIQIFLNGSGLITPPVNITYAQAVDSELMGSAP